ncbi:PRAME family member 6-like [Ictidomys tridecemlineatus]|uniref:PRAME family member 6-like n=1 Tax=Ictidomys tridecemlineatus TaxID=43179 RepID=UPI0006824524|nr:PRAME family member 6-like [Ictidomys tridecemlineatus]KAG3283656.1 PRAME family member 6-like [Ictidomys tridecemlineatus]
MSIQSPPKLLELAGRSLLSHKSRAVLDLEDLPIELFPPLFVEAFSREHTEVLKKMVQAWPFTCLPLGALMKNPQLEMIQVALDGLDMLLAQQHCQRQRRDRLHLCCNRLKIFGKPTRHTRKVLRLLQLDSVQRVEVHCAWAPSTLAAYAPFMGQMRNLRKLLVSQVLLPAHTSPEEQERLLAQLTSQFLRMNCLQTFCVDAVLLLDGHLEKVLRHLKMPLKALAITNCPLSDSDWNFLSRCPNTSQLRHLDLKGIKLTNFSLEPLKILLDTVAATLKSLDLEACEILDSQLQAILPALSRCSRLRALCFFQNHISMSVLRDLLCHTARLSQLSLELYPAPLESYDAQGAIHPRRCSQLCAELTAILKDFRQPKVLIFRTLSCPKCGCMFLYNQGLIYCSCSTAE